MTNTEGEREIALTEEEIAAIFKECKETKSIPNFKLDEQGRRIGWNKIPINSRSQVYKRDNSGYTRPGTNQDYRGGYG